jgi:hypothetical protein
MSSQAPAAGLAMLPSGTGLSKAIVARATSVFANAKAFLSGTSCSAESYIGGFNAG